MASKHVVEDLDSEVSKLNIKSDPEAELTLTHWKVHEEADADPRKAVTLTTTAGLHDTFGLELLFGQLTLETAELTISIASWNVNGSANAPERKAVTFPTTEDLQTDIVCLQEMKASYKGKNHGEAFHQYVAYDTIKTYSVVEKQEAGALYNTVLYKRERFTPLDGDWTVHSIQAFKLMTVKLETYKDIKKVEQKRPGWKMDELPQKTLGRLKCDEAFSGIHDDLLKHCIQEAIEEVKYRSIDEILQKRYTRTQSTETSSPKQLLEPRFATTLLKMKPIGIRILVISIHSPYTVMDTENFNYLLFEFLEMLAILGHSYPVLLAGDFNQDIVQSRSLRKFLGHYDVPEYDLTPLRKRKETPAREEKATPRRKAKKTNEKIDFILLHQPAVRRHYKFHLCRTKAIQFNIPKWVMEELKGRDEVEKHRTITNHSPVRTNLEILKVVERTAFGPYLLLVPLFVILTLLGIFSCMFLFTVSHHHPNPKPQ